MEIEVKEFGVRIRLIIEPAEGPEPPEEPNRVVESLEIEQRFRAWRREEARRRSVPQYIIMTERIIKAVVEERPADLEALGQIKGVGPKTMELYGEQIIEMVNQRTEEE